MSSIHTFTRAKSRTSERKSPKVEKNFVNAQGSTVVAVKSAPRSEFVLERLRTLSSRKATVALEDAELRRRAHDVAAEQERKALATKSSAAIALVFQKPALQEFFDFEGTETARKPLREALKSLDGKGKQKARQDIQSLIEAHRQKVQQKPADAANTAPSAGGYAGPAAKTVLISEIAAVQPKTKGMVNSKSCPTLGAVRPNLMPSPAALQGFGSNSNGLGGNLDSNFGANRNNGNDTNNGPRNGNGNGNGSNKKTRDDSGVYYLSPGTGAM